MESHESPDVTKDVEIAELEGNEDTDTTSEISDEESAPTSTSVFGYEYDPVENSSFDCSQPEDWRNSWRSFPERG